ELDPMTYLVVVNTVYFKGAWRNPFDPAATQPHDFMTPDGKITVPMMSAENDYIYQKNDDFEAVILPYAGTRMSMYVFLPSEELGLNGFIKKLNAEN
ncbi:MAG TPA: serpin family protein, partial [Armatimonadota bacterium]|nr:serpin family protein [Armatimonadota bacterium]